MSLTVRKNVIKTAIILTLSAIVCVLFLMYAFAQKAEADKQREIAEQQSVAAMAARREAEKAMQLMAETHQQTLMWLAQKDSIIQALQKKIK